MKIIWMLIYLLSLLSLSGECSGALKQERPFNKITVVSDDNYPPYVFRDVGGNIQGILVDQWKLWEKKTGIKVNLIGMDWDKALETMEQDKADVIDTIFFTEKRAQLYDFTRPYAKIDVPIFFQKNISGIDGIKSVQGFSVGVKKGDACIEVFKRNGIIKELAEYNSYEDIIKDASKGKVHVFCIDKPPALYYLNKYNLIEDYRYSLSLYTGEFHRAVKKGRKDLLAVVEGGFSEISKKEYAAIENKWLGVTLLTMPGYFKYIGFILGVIGTALILLLSFNLILRKQVKTKTSELIKTNLILQDEILERSQAESELRESEKRYRQLIEQAADGIFVTDADGRFLVVNSKACELLGYTEDEVYQLNILDTYPEGLREIGRQRLAHLQSGESLRFERPMKRKNGTVFLVEASASKLEDGRLQAIIHDITDRKQAEDEKRRLEFQLAHAQKIESIGTFAGGIAHDFNNILSAIIGYAELAMNQFSDLTKLQNSLMGVLKAGNRAKELVAEIITFSKHGETKCVPTMLSSTINDSYKLLRSIIPTSVEIRLKHLSPSLVMAEPTQIRRIIMNLCSNAAQAMGQTGGVLEISIENVNIDEGHNVPDPYLIPGRYLRLTISDTGHGMTPEVRERIYDPYFTTRELGKGSGLGLSVVQGIVKKHRGVITCNSKPGEGTTFDIYFPEIESGERQVECLEDVEPLIGMSNSTGTERILFIDDDSTLGYLASELLGSLGYEVVTKTSSIEALSIFREDPDKFDLVITDMTMPVLTGDRLAQKILEIRHDIPIILCTGYSEYISKERAESMGIREFIMKPFEMKEMAKTIRKVLDDGINIHD